MLIYTTLVIPSMTNTLSNVWDTANPIISNFWPILELSAGLIIGFGIVYLVIKMFSKFFS